MLQYPSSYNSTARDVAAAQKSDLALGFLPKSQPLSPQKHPSVQGMNITRRELYRPSSCGAGFQMYHQGWLRADNGILDQILYGRQTHSPVILLSTNQKETQERHNKADTFSPYTATTASQGSTRPFS